MKVLDLFCGAGGASVGLHRACKGRCIADITGVDINPQPEYPFEFILQDALTLPTLYVREFDFVWASPPCQAYSWSAKRWPYAYPDLISATRTLLQAAGTPYVIENVPDAPISRDLILTGLMFGLPIIRRRAFELSGFWVLAPMPQAKVGSVKTREYVTVAGHGGNGCARLSRWQEAMGIDWITDKKMLAEAVPPAYAEYIGRAFLGKG